MVFPVNRWLNQTDFLFCLFLVNFVMDSVKAKALINSVTVENTKVLGGTAGIPDLEFVPGRMDVATKGTLCCSFRCLELKRVVYMVLTHTLTIAVLYS
jgi:hypothetical protein